MVSRSEKRLSAKAVAAFRDAGRYADGGGLYLIEAKNLRALEPDLMAASADFEPSDRDEIDRILLDE